MKYCTKCGERLAQPNPKHCPECGETVKIIEAQKEQKVEVQPAKKEDNVKLAASKRDIAMAAAACIVLAAVLMVIVVSPVAYWNGVNAAGAQYYQSYALFSKDVGKLDWLSGRYGAIPLDETTFARKAAAADAYAIEAGKDLVTWDYLSSFMAQKQAELKSFGVNVAASQKKMNESRSKVKEEAGAMAFELKDFIGANSEKAGSAAGTLNELRAISGKK